MRPSLSRNSFALSILSSSFFGMRQTSTVLVSVPGHGLSAEANKALNITAAQLLVAQGQEQSLLDKRLLLCQFANHSQRPPPIECHIFYQS